MKRMGPADILAGEAFQNGFDHLPLLSLHASQGIEIFDPGEVVEIRWDLTDIVLMPIAIA